MEMVICQIKFDGDFDPAVVGQLLDSLLGQPPASAPGPTPPAAEIPSPPLAEAGPKKIPKQRPKTAPPANADGQFYARKTYAELVAKLTPEQKQLFSDHVRTSGAAGPVTDLCEKLGTTNWAFVKALLDAYQRESKV